MLNVPLPRPKLAVTRRVTVIVTWHVPAPEQSCDHPANVLFEAVWVSDTRMPNGKSKLHVPLVLPPVVVQLIPAGDDVTRPDPAPVPDRYSDCGAPKLALTVWFVASVSVQVGALPEQPPDHEPNVEPEDAVVV